MGNNPPLSWNTVIELIMKLAIVLYSMGLGNYNILSETYVRYRYYKIWSAILALTLLGGQKNLDQEEKRI